MKSWTPNIDPATIPDDVLKSERARRNAAKRASYSGGIYWKQHNPETSRCRCERCMARRFGASVLARPGSAVPAVTPISLHNIRYQKYTKPGQPRAFRPSTTTYEVSKKAN